VDEETSLHTGTRRWHTVQVREDFAEVIDRLEQRLHLVQDALDDIHTEIQWAVRNNKPIHIHSMSHDPAAANFKVNEVSEEVVGKLRQELLFDK